MGQKAGAVRSFHGPSHQLDKGLEGTPSGWMWGQQGLQVCKLAENIFGVSGSPDQAEGKEVRPQLQSYLLGNQTWVALCWLPGRYQRDFPNVDSEL